MFSRWLILAAPLSGAAFVLGGTTPAYADCQRNGSTVTCTGTDANGFNSGAAGLQLQVTPGSLVRNVDPGGFMGVCGDPEDGLSGPAISLGDRTRVTNQGSIVAFGVCGVGVSVGDNATVANVGNILTDDALGHGISAGDAAAITNSGSITTRGGIGGLSYGIWVGDGSRVETTAGSSIDVAGAGSYGILAGAQATIISAGTITAPANDGINVGAGSSVTNSGTITVSTGQIAAIRGTGDNIRIVNSGTLTANNLATTPSANPGAGVAITGANATFENTGQVTGSFAGVAITTSGSSSIVNSGTISGGGEVLRDNLLADYAGGVIIRGTGSVMVTNNGALQGLNGRQALRSDVPIQFINRGNVDGNVMLSGGDDFVTLTSGSSLNGVLDGNGGADRLTLDNFGFLRQPVKNFTSLTKIGASTWTLDSTASLSGDAFITTGTFALSAAGRLSVPRVTVNAAAALSGTGRIDGNVSNSGTVAIGSGPIGTLTVAGDYTQLATGVLRLRATATGTDKLIIGGTATLGGTLVIDSTTRYRGGQTFQIMSALGTAMSTAGSFGTIQVATTTFVKPEIVSSASGVVLQLTKLPYAAAGRTAAQRAVANMLERQTAPNALLAPIVAGFDTGTLADAAAVFAALAPETAPAVLTAGLSSISLLRDARQEALTPTSVDHWRAWGSFIHREGHTRSNADAAAYDTTLNGGTAGMDVPVGRGRLGFAVGYGEGTNAFADGAQSRLPLTVLSATAAYPIAALKLDAQAAVSFGFGTAHTSRVQTLQGVSRAFGADADARAWSVDGGVSRHVDVRGVTLNGHAGLSYSRVTLGVLDEGASLALRTGPAAADSFASDVGLRGEVAIGRVRPFIGASWVQEYLSTARRVPAVLIGVPDSGFVLSGAAPRRAQIIGDVGIRADVAPGIMLQARFQTAFNDPLVGRRITAGAVWRW